MCMIGVIQNEKEITTNVAYKVLVKESEGLKTPFQKALVVENRLVADGPICFEQALRCVWVGEENKVKLVDEQDLFEGAIHCCRVIEAAKYWCEVSKSHGACEPEPNVAIYKVKGNGYIAHNNNEIAYKSIKVCRKISKFELFLRGIYLTLFPPKGAV